MVDHLVDLARLDAATAKGRRRTPPARWVSRTRPRRAARTSASSRASHAARRRARRDRRRSPRSTPRAGSRGAIRALGPAAGRPSPRRRSSLPSADGTGHVPRSGEPTCVISPGVITAWRYVSGVGGRTEVEPDHLGAAVDAVGAVVWVDCASPAPDDLAWLREQLGIGPVVVDALDQPGAIHETAALRRLLPRGHPRLRVPHHRSRASRDRPRDGTGMAGHGAPSHGRGPAGRRRRGRARVRTPAFGAQQDRGGLPALGTVRRDHRPLLQRERRHRRAARGRRRSSSSHPSEAKVFRATCSRSAETSCCSAAPPRRCERC